MHNQTELDPLVSMAVGHYQFEAIHPFADGNGRTGRVINILYLIQAEPLAMGGNELIIRFENRPDADKRKQKGLSTFGGVPFKSQKRHKLGFLMY